MRKQIEAKIKEEHERKQKMNSRKDRTSMDGRPTTRSSQTRDRSNERKTASKGQALELQLEEERRKREEMEKIWSETQYDEVWEDKDGLSQWYGEGRLRRPKDIHQKTHCTLSFHQ